MKLLSGIKSFFSKGSQLEEKSNLNQNANPKNLMTTEFPLSGPARYRMPSIENCYIPSAFQAESGEKLGSSNLMNENAHKEEIAAFPSIPTLVRIPSSRGDHLLGSNYSPENVRVSPGQNSSPLRRRRTALTQFSHPHLFAVQSPIHEPTNRQQIPSSPFIEEPVSAYLKSRKLSTIGSNTLKIQQASQQGIFVEPQTPRVHATSPINRRQSSPRMVLTVRESTQQSHVAGLGASESNTLYIKDTLKDIQKQKAKSMIVQKLVLDRLGIKLPTPENRSPGALISMVQNLGEYGLKLERMALEIEKRYEAMFTDLDYFIDSLKEFIVQQLDEHKYELLERLVAEKTQNKDNFDKLETQLFDLSAKQKQIIEGGYHPQVKHKLAAFRQFFDFSDEFAEEFYGMISSKMLTFNVANVQEQLSKQLGSVIFDGIKAPKAFPTELIRFFEQLQMKLPTMTPTEIDAGSVIYNKTNFPYSLRISPVEIVKFSQPFGSQSEAGDSRRFSLLSWVDNRTLLIGTRESYQLCSFTRTFESCAEDQDVSQIPYGIQLDTKHRSNPFPPEFSVESLVNLVIEKTRYIIVGGNNSVSSSSLQQVLQITKLSQYSANDDIPTFTSTQDFDLKQNPKVKPGKITKILQYKNTHLGVVCVSTGQLVVVNFLKQSVIHIIKSHAGSLIFYSGNVTSATWMDNFHYLATCSGSFNKKHDNSISVYRVFFLENELIVKKFHTINNIHGK